MVTWLWRAGWLLLLAAWLSHHFALGAAVTFFLACASLVPLAKTMGDATEALAARLGPTAGSLLNASFGNAAELIVGFAALRHGRIALVKGSITGSILGNLLLVAGASVVVGGARFPRLRFNKLLASSSLSTLFLAVVALIVPTLLAASGGPHPQVLSDGIAAVLLSMYALSLLFVLGTHREHVSPAASPETHLPRRPAWFELGKLALAAAFTAVASELLVDALGGALGALRMSETFVGVIVVAIVGNAAEHSTAVIFAHRGDMDVAPGIAWESSKQIALFIAPVLVFASMLLGAPMDLAFTRLEVIALGLAVLALGLIAIDGETHWLEGAFLLAVYAVLGMGFYFVV